VVRDGRIVALMPTEDARRTYATRIHTDLATHALIPGLVNLHTHAAMALMRGLADDLPLMEWLTQHIWPAEGKHVSAQFVFEGTLLACAEMIRGGVTCFNDMYFFPDVTARVSAEAGGSGSPSPAALRASASQPGALRVHHFRLLTPDPLLASRGEGAGADSGRGAGRSSGGAGI